MAYFRRSSQPPTTPSTKLKTNYFFSSIQRQVCQFLALDRMRILPGFATLNVISVLTDTLSIGLNIGLIYMLRERTKSLDQKTVQFSIAYAILSIIFAVVHGLIQPFEVIFDGVGLSFPGSFLHGTPVVEYIQSYGLSPCYMALLECGAFNFLYKYAATCNKSLYNRFNDKRFVCGMSAIAATWLVLYTYFGAFFNPTPAFREKVAVALNERFSTDFRDPTVFWSGIDSQEHGDEKAQGFGPVIAMLNFLSLITFCLGTMMWCGWRIQRMITSNRMTERAKKIHRKALRLLVLQTANPLFFAVVPAIAPVFFIQARVTLPESFSWFNAYGLLFFPLLNPIIFVICTKEFRNRMLSYILKGPGAASKPPITSASFSVHFHRERSEI